MAKELIVNALVNFLGDYVEGFTKENIKVGILSGKIILKGLGINREGIRRHLNLPINIVHGYVETLEVHVPWTNLDKERVQIYINGVHLLVNPLNAATHTKADAQQRVYLYRKYRLFQAEKSIKIAAQLTNASDGMTHVSYFQNLVAKVVENLDTKVTSIHIRFEDSSKHIAYGFFLESFSIVTTDSNWRETFLTAEDLKGQTTPLPRYKLASIRNLGVYWSNTAVMCGDIPFEEWLRFMKDISNPTVANNFLLHPPNDLSMQLSHITPNLHIHIHGTNLHFQLDKTQYRDIQQTSASLHHFQRMQRYLQYRPEQGPANDPRGWWRYALILVTERERILQKKVCICLIWGSFVCLIWGCFCIYDR